MYCKIESRMAGKMAAAELKHDNVSCDETAKSNVSTVISHREIECYRFRVLDLLYYFSSLSFFFVDVATDSIIFMEYFLQGHLTWGYFAMSFTIVPAGIIQLFSLRWYHSDGSIKNIHWLLHFLFLGVLHRYLILLYTAIHSLRSKQFVKDKNWVYRQESDICMLHLFKSFMGAAPQLILQLYIMTVLHRTPLWTSISAVVSFCSLTWAIGTYTKAMHKINPGHDNTSSIALTLQALWRGGMLISRITVLVLTAVFVRKWFLLFFGLHWLFMTIWVILQNTDFCPTVWEERIYNCIIGLIYCFDFFNLRVGKSRYRVFIFYSIIVIQNLVSLIVYALYFKDTTKTDALVVITSVIVGGMMVGLTSMIFYYGKFHPSKMTNVPKGADESSKVVAEKTASPRSFKQYYSNSFASLPRSNDDSQRSASEEVTTDKQFLLTNIVQISESAEDGIVNQTCNIENESKTALCIISECESPHNFPKDEATPANQSSSSAVENTCEYLEAQNECNDATEKEIIHRRKRRGICLPTVHDLDMEKNDGNACLPSQKRRGICSSAQLILEIESSMEEQNSLDEQNLESGMVGSSDMDVKCDKHEDSINHARGALDIIKIRDRLKTPAIFDGEKILETEKLPKDLQQRDETMSCVTSIHDYENVCPLGVARPPWCIRSWKGYTDIETYIHDDSVVRDRRRDTLTSTTTGTTYSSEFSDMTCASSVLRGIFKQDDYLDTLAYDLIEPPELRATYIEDMSVKSSNVDEQNATLYIAKPVVIDDKGGMFALDTILEEHDEPSVDEKLKYTQPNCDSVSTLVNTIDQIRRYTAENSPRHIYHTTGSQWEDLDPKNFIKRAQLTRALFKNDLKNPATCNRNYINCLDESDSIVRGKCEIDTIRELVQYCAIESIKKTPLIDAILSDSPILGNKAKLQKQAAITYQKQDSVASENDLYVEMSPLVPVENPELVHNDVCDTVLPSTPLSLQEEPDLKPAATSTNTAVGPPPCDKRKKTLNYSKRKFSLLKERFEPKSQLVYVVTPNSAIKVGQSASPPDGDGSKKNVSVILKKTPDLSTKHDKENLAPLTVSNQANSTVNSTEKTDAIYENDKSLCNADINLKERRHIFLEQVLSPPKLLTWNKKKTFVPAATKL